LANQVFAPGQYAAIIGAGGAADANGSDSIVEGIATSSGGGRGAGSYAPGTGGSGGGGKEGWNFAGNSGGVNTYTAAVGNTPATSPAQGYGGGNGQSDGVSWAAGGGGGGSWGFGGNGSGAYPENSYGGPGGSGNSAYSSWATATGTGVNGYYAGGGGGAGGGGTNPNGGSGGAGGGGTGGYRTTPGTSAVVNTGSGGGGFTTSGGSGLIILRYLKSLITQNPDAYELLDTVVIGLKQTSIVFSSISSEYKHLQIRMMTRCDYSGDSSDIYMRVNGDSTAANYVHHGLYSTGSAAGSESQVGINPGARVAQSAGSTFTSGVYFPAITDITDYANSSRNKTMKTLSGNTGTYNRFWFTSELWRSTAPITSLTFVLATGSSFIAGSRISIYGLRG